MSRSPDELPAPRAFARTPQRIFLADSARRRFMDVARRCAGVARPPLSVRAGYSIKTNPRPEMLALAREAGLLAESISRAEVDAALASGFDAGDIVYNGPAPLANEGLPGPLGFIFADSLEALERNVRRRVAHVQGIRLRPSMIASRFGIAVDDDDDLASAVARIPAETGVACSFHARREDFHGATWLEVAEDVLKRAASLERRTGRAVVAFDVGGGWTPGEFDDTFVDDMRALIERLIVTLPSCASVLCEPGQAVATPAEALLAEVTEVRRGPHRQEVVVDIGYPDWPQMHEYRHRMFAWRDERWEPIGRGPDAIAGRTCLEYDRLDGLQLPTGIAAGDRLLIADVGSYDRSMAFDFADAATGSGEAGVPALKSHER